MKTLKEIPSILKGLKPGDKVYTQVSHVARSGMMRRVRVYIVDDGEIRDVTYHVGQVIGSNVNDDGIKMGGCGYDVTFEVVYSLGRAMFPNGTPCAGKDVCLSNDHNNGDRDYTAGKIHVDGGYTFRNSRI